MSAFISVRHGTLLAAALALAACTPKPKAPATAPAAVAMTGALPVHPDTAAASRDSMVRVVLASIAGRETQPAESVFTNVRLFRGVPAQQVLRIMNQGYGRALGVSCAHCHVLGEWASEDKPQKQVARDMVAMMRRINSELLPAVRNLRSDRPAVTCSTCHRGDVRPATSMR